MAQEIQFSAAVYKVQTLVDGGIRVTLDLPETEIMQMAQLAECQRFGIVLSVTCKTEEKQNDASMAKRTERQSRWKAKEETSVNSGA